MILDSTNPDKSVIQSVQIQQLFSSTVASLVTSVLLAALLTYVQHGAVGGGVAVGWFVAILLVTIVRGALFLAYRQAAVEVSDSGIWLMRYRWGVLIAGVIWGSAGVLLFPDNDLRHQMFLTFILAGLSTGGVVSYSADLFSAIGFATTSLLPFALRMLVEEDSLSVSMGMSGILYIGFMVSSVIHINRNMRENTLLRLDALRTQNVLQESESRFRVMLEFSPIAVRVAEAGGRSVVFANQRYDQLINVAPGKSEAMDPRQYYVQPQVYDETLQQLAQGKRVVDKLVELAIPGQGIKWALASYLPFKFENRDAVLGWFYDITQRKQLEEQMHELAFYDALTKLPNRRLLIDRLSQALISAVRNHRHGALMFLDLDYFKSLNDLHGHDIGDQMLVEVAKRILACVREQDSVARFGGDEFVVMLEELSVNQGEAVKQTDLVAEKIRVALAEPYLLKRNEEVISHFCSSSIGVTLFGEHDHNPEQLLKWTDVAMYQAKDDGRNVIRFFDPDMQTAIEMRAALESDMHVALQQQQFKLFYQVQVNAIGRPQGAEVLLRWQHPKRGLIAPGQFIPLAEETSLILSIGSWVLHTACAQIRKWQDQAEFRNLAVAVNVSAKQFRQPDFVEQVQAAVLQHAINPMSLKLELTESLVLDNVADTIVKMKALKEFGVRFSMDDFGTGYSSLSYLKRLPLDQLKIDQSFVRDITTDKADMVMVMTIVDLGMNFEVDVIAEGVETEEQFKLLHRYGCVSFQGYLFSKPIPVEQFEELILKKLSK